MEMFGVLNLGQPPSTVKDFTEYLLPKVRVHRSSLFRNRILMSTFSADNLTSLLEQVKELPNKAGYLKLEQKGEDDDWSVVSWIFGRFEVSSKLSSLSFKCSSSNVLYLV